MPTTMIFIYTTIEHNAINKKFQTASNAIPLSGTGDIRSVDDASTMIRL